MIKPIAVGIICALHIILFIYTGIHKILDYEEFRYQIGRSPFLEHMTGFVSIAIPTVELLIAVLLIGKPTRLLGLYASFGLMALFAGYIWLMLHYAYDLPCSCGGIVSQLSWKQHLFFNLGFTLLAACGVLLERQLLNNPSALDLQSTAHSPSLSSR